MKIIDIRDSERVNRKPTQVEVLFSSGDYLEQGFLISRVELRLYVEKTDEKCDICGADMQVKLGKNGKFLSCSKYPECKNAKPMKEDRDKEEMSGLGQ